MTTETEITENTVASLCACEQFESVLARAIELHQSTEDEFVRMHLSAIRNGMTNLRSHPASIVESVAEQMPLPEPTPIEDEGEEPQPE